MSVCDLFVNGLFCWDVTEWYRFEAGGKCMGIEGCSWRSGAQGGLVVGRKG